MNTGMQDALNLGWKLALTVSGAASSTLLQTYESERLLNARNVLRSALKYQRFLIPRGSLAILLSSAFFKAVMTIRTFGERIARKVGMLDVNYGNSSLSRQDSRQTASHTGAGWHVPDAPCRRNGNVTGLFKILRGTRANLLRRHPKDQNPLRVSSDQASRFSIRVGLMRALRFNIGSRYCRRRHQRHECNCRRRAVSKDSIRNAKARNHLLPTGRIHWPSHPESGPFYVDRISHSYV